MFQHASSVYPKQELKQLVRNADPLYWAETRNSTSIELAGRAWGLSVHQFLANNEADRIWIAYRLDVVTRELDIRERSGDPVSPIRSSSNRYDLERIRSEFTLDQFLPAVAAMDLQWKGSRWAGRCPFPDHEDGEASFSVRGDGVVFNCFGCGKGGDIFSFAELWFATRSFIHAVELVVTTMGRRLEDYRLANQSQLITRSPRRSEVIHVR